MQGITWQQVAMTGLLLGVTFAAYHWLGEGAAAAMTMVMTIVTFMMGRKPEAGA